MRKKEKLNRLLDNRMVAIVRLTDGKMVTNVVESLVIGGIKTLEITSNTPNFSTEIKEARLRYPDVLIGAGTVTDLTIAKKAIDCGAQFLVTPNTNKEVVKLAESKDIPVLMGAFTPTEVVDALNYGADIIKLFPANMLGIPYFKTLKGPLNNIDFFAVGGIGLHNMNDWIEAGVSGLGIGSSLVPTSVSTEKDLENIRKKSTHFTSEINKIR